MTRLCGERKPGVYGVCGTSPFGKSIWSFLCCPPQEIPFGLELPDIGQVIAQGDHGLYHVWDHVGNGHYPNVADFIMETAFQGASRRWSPLLPYHLLTPGSRMIFVHDRAIIDNWESYGDPYWRCPVDKTHTIPHREHMDVSLYWEDLFEEAKPYPWDDWYDQNGLIIHPYYCDRQVKRDLAFPYEYVGYSRPENVAPQYRPGVFMSLPITQIVNILGPDAKENKKNLDAISKSSIPVDEFYEGDKEYA